MEHLSLHFIAKHLLLHLIVMAVLELAQLLMFWLCKSLNECRKMNYVKRARITFHGVFSCCIYTSAAL